jgi:hypothetical protein
MKRMCLFMGLMAGLAGCVTPPPSEPIQPAMSMASPAARPVRADQVTTENARQVADSLADELDREAQREIVAPGRSSGNTKNP